MNCAYARRFAALALACAIVPQAHAAWPDDKPIELIVGFAAGGETDVMARALAPYLQKHLGGKATVAVINRPGASGEIANAYVQRAAPDGYTLGVVNTPPMAFVPLYKKTQYDPAKFALIGRVVSDPTLLVVRADSPYQDLKQIAAALKEKPASVSVGQNGVGSNGNVAMNLWQREAGFRFNDVPFSGTGPSKTALLGKHIDMMFASMTAVPDPEKEAVPLRIVAQFMEDRAKGLPNVPTAKEQGFDVAVPSDRGLAVQSDVPADIQQRLRAALEAAMTDPAFLKTAQAFESVLSYLPGDAWQKSLDDSRPGWQALASEVKDSEK